ncbi:MAG TPA: flavodoxin domain-containing protein [Clostridiaceae bacterium]|nr:flavodoxin domain-containing protein [Clostridiaceae bacterium]
MSRIAVVYKSNYGHTKRYAEWIAGDLQGDLFDLSAFSPDHIEHYDTVVFGGGLYASGILGHSFIVQEFQRLRKKNLILFTVGLAATEDQSIFAPILHKNFPDEVLNELEVFHLRGGIEYKELGLKHKTMMAMLRTKVSRNKGERTDEEALMLSTYGDKIDFSDEKSIAPLTTYVKSLDFKDE